MTAYDASVDVFALGWIMVEMYLLKPLFWGSSSLDQLSKYWKIIGTRDFIQWKEGVKIAQNMGFEIPQYESGWISEKLLYASPDALNLIKMLLQFNPKSRVSIDEILNHSFFGNTRVNSKLSKSISLHNISSK